MAFIVQDATGAVTDANAYISVAEFKEYHTDRGTKMVNADGVEVAIDDFDDAEIENCIIVATDYIDNLRRYAGSRLTGSSQTTQFPRVNLFDREGEKVDGIPRKVKHACAEYGFFHLVFGLNMLPSADSSGLSIKSKKEKVGPLEESTEYETSKSPNVLKYVPQADRLLVEYVVRTSGRVIR